MKTARARRRRGPSAATPPAASEKKLPIQAWPVQRGIARDPIHIRIVASDSGCEQCIDECRGGPLQPVCESLCAAVCNK